MQKQLTAVAFDKLIWGDNVRLTTSLAIPDMVDAIKAIGYITEPPTVIQQGDSYLVGCGNRRTKGLDWLKDHEPETFKKACPKGMLDCIVVSDATEQEIAAIIVDQGGQLPLSNPHEVQLAANKWFDVNATEEDVAVNLATLLDRVSPMKPEKKKELKELQASLAEAKEAKVPTLVAKLEKQVRKFLLEARRGMVQGLHMLYRCPDVVMEARYYHANMSEHRPGQTAFKPEDFVPTVTNAKAKELFDAFQADLKVVDDKGKRLYHKGLPGPNFQALWKKLVEQQKKRAESNAPAPVRKKRIAANEITSMAEGLRSDMVQVLRYLTGDAQKPELTEIDQTLYIAGLVKEHDADLWKKVCESAAAIQKKLVTASVEEAAKAEGDKPKADGESTGS